METEITQLPLKQLLDLSWENYSMIGSLVDVFDEWSIEITMADGTTVNPWIGKESKSTYAYDTPSYQNGEKVVDAILREGLDPKDLKMITAIHKWRDYRSGSSDEEGEDIKIFIPVKGDKTAAHERMIYEAALALADGKMSYFEYREITKKYLD